MKNLFNLSTKTIVAIGLGAALFTLLFMYVAIPTGIPNTNLQTAYGISAFFGALFGPLAGCLVAFIGHAITDTVLWGAPWWSWVIASGVTGFIAGLSFRKLKVEEGIFTTKDALTFNGYQVVGNLLAWLLVAPVLDYLIFPQDIKLLVFQGVTAAVVNIVSTAIIGTLLLSAYSKTRSQKGSLSKEA